MGATEAAATKISGRLSKPTKCEVNSTRSQPRMTKTKRRPVHDGVHPVLPPAKRSKKQPARRSQTTQVSEARTEINEPPKDILTVFAFGDGEHSELGMGPSCIESTVPRLNPFIDPNGNSKFKIRQLACGGMHSVAITADNKIVTWGINDSGTLGRTTEWDGGLRDMDAGLVNEEDVDLNPLESTPGEVAIHHFEPGAVFAQVAAGDSCTFALTTDGSVYGWGTFRNAQGDECFGHDVEGSAIQQQSTPMLIKGLPKIVQIVCGANHLLALDTKGIVWGWGDSEENQLGHRLFGRHQNSFDPRPVRVCRGKVTYIASGECHSFALDQRGEVWAWGRNTNNEAAPGGQYGTPSYPQRIRSFSGQHVVHLCGGANHSVAITADGRCFAWGKMDAGQLGIEFSESDLQDESIIRRGIRDEPEVCARPTVVQNIGFVTQAACGIDHTIFINTDGNAFSTGFNLNGQLGLKSTDDVSVARQITAKTVRDRKLSWTGAGGHFSFVAEVATSANA